jgi:hypothetical protein
MEQKYINVVDGLLVLSDKADKDCDRTVIHNAIASSSLTGIRNINIHISKGGQIYILPTHLNKDNMNPATLANYSISKWRPVTTFAEVVNLANAITRKINHTYPFSIEDNVVCKVLKSALNSLDGLDVPSTKFTAVHRLTEQLRKGNANVSPKKCLDLIIELSKFMEVSYEFKLTIEGVEHKVKDGELEK